MKQSVTRGCKRALCTLLVMVMLLSSLTIIPKEAKASSYPYQIKVNKQKNCVTIYGKDKNGKYTKPVKSMICSAGWDTPIGTFTIPSKYRWRLMDGDVWAQYATRITGSILFHSVWYYERDPATLSTRQYNNLGTTCSHGCVRLSVKDSKWIYDNCPAGTSVQIYNGNKFGALGRPEAIKIPSNIKWDPTDIWSKGNPYNNKKPVIKGVRNKTVKFGTKLNLKYGVTALSSVGGGITSSIKVKGNVNTKKAGKYKVNYAVTDLLGRKDTKNAIYTVLADKQKPIITGVTNKIVGPKTKITKDYALNGVKAYLGNKRFKNSRIKVSIKKKNQNVYDVTYYVKANNGKSVLKRSKITVDRVAPVFKGVNDKEILWNTKMSNALMLKGVSVNDNITKMKNSDIKVKINKNDNDSYSVTYTAKDAVGNIAKKTRIITRTCSLEIKGAKDKNITAETIIDEAYVLEGITAFDKGKDITEDIVVTISECVDNVYTVTYEIMDLAERTKKVTVKFIVTEGIVDPEKPIDPTSPVDPTVKGN